MPDSAGPFEGGTWSEAEWYRFAPAWAPSGVLGSTPAASASQGSFGTSASGLTLSTSAGRAIVSGAGFERVGATSTPVPANANATLSRRDRLVIRRDLAAKTVTIRLVQGTPAASPVPPSVTQNDAGIWELPLCSFLVPPASGTGLSGFLDERLWITPGASVLTAMTTDALLAQPALGEGTVALVLSGTSRGQHVYAGSAWTRLGAWTESASSTFTWSLPGSPANLPGIQGGTDASVTVTVPAGRTLDVELHLPIADVKDGSTAYARLTANGSTLAGAAVSTDAGVSHVWPLSLAGSVLGTGAPVTVSPQAWRGGGVGATIRGETTWGLPARFRYRIV
jgi:hypothetical protein